MARCQVCGNPERYLRSYERAKSHVFDSFNVRSKNSAWAQLLRRQDHWARAVRKEFAVLCTFCARLGLRKNWRIEPWQPIFYVNLDARNRLQPP
jgi:hypothetical protein